jgi:chromosome segregation ATPase
MSSRDPSQEDYDYKPKASISKKEVPRFGDSNQKNNNPVISWNYTNLILFILLSSISINIYLLYFYRKDTSIKSEIVDLKNEIKNFNEKNKNSPDEINNIKNALVEFNEKIDEIQSRKDSCLDELEKLKTKTTKP